MRVYLDKDSKGKMKFITIHMPIKLSSQEEDEKLTEKLRKILKMPYFVNNRGSWLDLIVKSSWDALGIDLFDCSSLKAAIERFTEKAYLYLNRAKV